MTDIHGVPTRHVMVDRSVSMGWPTYFLTATRLDGEKKYRLLVSSSHDTRVSVATMVDSRGIEASAEVRTQSDGRLLIRVSIKGIAPATSSKYRVRAAIYRPLDRAATVADLLDDGKGADRMRGDAVFTAAVHPPAGKKRYISVIIKGPHSRYLTLDQVNDSTSRSPTAPRTSTRPTLAVTMLP